MAMITISLRLTKDLYESARIQATHRKLTISEYIRSLIREGRLSEDPLDDDLKKLIWKIQDKIK